MRGGVESGEGVSERFRVRLGIVRPAARGGAGRLGEADRHSGAVPDAVSRREARPAYCSLEQAKCAQRRRY